MRNQIKSKQKALSKSNDRKTKKSNSILAIKKQQKIVKKPISSEDIVFSPKTISYKKGT